VLENEISEVTRRAIFDHLATSEISWCGRLADDDFLARLYDLTKLPSYDNRYRNAAGDIHQHRINNYDWPEDWVFSDVRFNLLHGSDENFLRFLSETVHPLVRTDLEQVRTLVAAYNAELRADGWEIVEVKQISGKPVFGFRKMDGRAVIFEEPTGWQKVDRQVQEMRARLDSATTEEQFQAVGLLCREIMISAAQEVYNGELHKSEDGIAPSETDAKRMLEAIFSTELSGSANEEARSHARASVKLALALQHKRTADFRMAALCAEGTLSVINLLAIVAGRRGRAFS
jgi:hypothetical protein